MYKETRITRNGKEFIDVIKLLPIKTSSNGKRILWFGSGNGKIRISVNKYGVRGGNAKPVEIKRFIPICPLLLEGFGLWLGDGIKVQGGEEKVFGFCNTEFTLIKLFLEFSNSCLGIPPEKFNGRVSLPESVDNAKEIKKTVSGYLEIPIQNFWKNQVLENRNKICIDVKINSLILATVVQSIFISVIGKLKNEQVSSISFLKGMMAAEGNVHVRRCGRLGEIMIAAHRSGIRTLVRKSLENIGVEPSKDKMMEGDEGIMIHGFQNFKIIEKYDICSLHPSKNESLKRGINGFKEIQFKKGKGQIIILENILKGLITSRELSEKLNRSQHTINFHLRKLYKKGLVEKLKVKSKKVTWGITNTGKEFLKSKSQEKLYFT